MLAGVLRAIRGIEVTDETPSYEVIGEVIDGPGLWLALEASDAANCFGDLSMEMQSAGVPIC